jgi:hypothetical protein
MKKTGICLLLSVCINAQSDRIIYQHPLTSSFPENQWLMEGPGLVDISAQGMGMKSLFYDAFMEEWLAMPEDERLNIGAEGINQMMYEIALEKDPEHAQAAMTNNGFKGGHTVYWLNLWLPKNIVIEYEFQNISPAGLYINFFSAQADGGSIFDPDLAKRNGVFTQYTNGDFQSYHISFGARFDGNMRGDSHLRKNPSNNNIPLAECEDLVAAKPYNWHKIKITQWDNTIEFRVNNQICLKYRRAMPEKGFFGIRQMSTSHAYYKNLTITEMTGNTSSDSPGY